MENHGYEEPSVLQKDININLFNIGKTMVVLLPLNNQNSNNYGLLTAERVVEVNKIWGDNVKQY